MSIIRKAYTNWATSYDTDRNLTRDLDAVVTRQMLTQDYQNILEIGAGTGKNTDYLAKIGGQVLALDFSEGMIAQAKAKVQAANIEYKLSDITSIWPLRDAQVDLVVGNLVLEHIENLDFIFAEARRVLKPGGQFFICELHPFRQYQGRKATFQQGDEQIEIPAFVHHLSNFTDAAKSAGFALTHLNEWWHEADESLAPRLVSFLFERPTTD